jgi:hypothetical protein
MKRNPSTNRNDRAVVFGTGAYGLKPRLTQTPQTVKRQGEGKAGLFPLGAGAAFRLSLTCFSRSGEPLRLREKNRIPPFHFPPVLDIEVFMGHLLSAG